MHISADLFRKAWPELANVLLFVLITVVFHILWKVFQDQIESSALIVVLGDWLANRAYVVSVWINHHILALDFIAAPKNLIHFKDSGTIVINETCSGLKQFYQLTVLFVLFPGPWKHKTWFIPAGILLMHWTNIFRVVILSLVMAYAPQHWDFTHDWILRPFFYFVMFLYWLLWVERFKPARNRT